MNTHVRMKPSQCGRTYSLLCGALLSLVQVLFYAACADSYSMYQQLMLAPGSTRALSSIFKGRCHDYIDCTLPHASTCDQDPLRKSVNCSHALIEFIDAIAAVDPCSVPDDAYDTLLEESGMVHSPTDETLFWSGTKEIAINMATVTDRYTSIERTLAGYILNGLMWCGKASDGVTYTIEGQDQTCPLCPKGVPDATYQFWRAASRHFAAQARGSVSLLLNSTRDGGAFRNTSTFAMEELPNITDEVTHVYIHLVGDVRIPESHEREGCDSKGSVMTLRKMLEEKGLNYTCIEDDTQFILIQCVEYPDALPCQRFNSATPLSGTQSLSTMVLIWLLGRLIQSFR